jgi:hypothetical protein
MQSFFKKIFNLVTLIIFWMFPFSLLYLLLKKVNIEPFKYIPSLYFIFLLTSVLYKKYWSFKLFSNKIMAIKILLLFSVSLLLFMYLNTIVYRANKLYNYLTAEKKRSWEGIAHQADDTLGFKPVANARAYHTFTIGDKIPMAYDKNGFRIPLQDTLKNNKTDKVELLFLGCTFTYGDACYAEETFPYLVAKETNLSYINAGVCSYGLAQMLILAEKLIPKYKPQYIIVQYSSWLAARGVNVYAPIDFVYLSNPYFIKKDNKYTLEYPAFKSQAFDLDGEKVKKMYANNFMRFLFEKGVLFYLKEDWLYQKNKVLMLMGKCFKPAANINEVENYAYNKINAIAETNGTTIIILNVGNIEYSKKSHSLFSGSPVQFAEADSMLNESLKYSISKNYSKEFNHWRFNGKDSVLVDLHPNFKAHRIIANSIIKEIKKGLH